MTDDELIQKLVARGKKLVWHEVVSLIEKRDYIPWHAHSPAPTSATRQQIRRLIQRGVLVSAHGEIGPYTICPEALKETHHG